MGVDASAADAVGGLSISPSPVNIVPDFQLQVSAFHGLRALSGWLETAGMLECHRINDLAVAPTND